MQNRISLAIASVVAVLGVQAAAPAAVSIAFANGDTFDNDAVNGTAGPFTDAATGVSGTITTTAIAPSGSVNTTAGSLGINSGSTGTSFISSFDNGESWSFALNVPSQLTSIDFGSYSTTSENPGFTLQSAAFVGSTFTPASASVTFVSATGTFSFGNTTTSDTFTAADLYGAATPPTVTAGTSLKLSYASSAATTDFATLDNLTFNLVPEPTTIAAVLAGAAVVLPRRRSAR